MACCLDLQKRLCCPQFGCDAAKFALKCFRIPHRHSGLQLVPASMGKLDEFVQGALRYTHRGGAVHQRKELPHGFVERSRQAWYAIFEIKEILRRDHLVPERDMMAPSTFEPCDVP